MNEYSLRRLINDGKKNIFNVSIPLDALIKNDSVESDERKMVVFLGDNFMDLPGTDLGKALRITNQCLDYIRRECAGYDLYYKPHPKPNMEKNEIGRLDLSGFKMESGILAELFYIQNIKKIKYVFATCSMGSITAHKMGLNSYSFLNIVGTSFASETLKGKIEAFSGMPSEFFINSFDQPLRENRRNIGSDTTMEERLCDIFSQKQGPVWLLTDVSALVDAIAIATLIKKLEPEKTVNLISGKHNRWNLIPTEDVTVYFDNTFFVPRVFYSLRPARIWESIKYALKVKKIPIKQDDVILHIPGLGFGSSCFVSYFRKSMHVNMLTRDTFSISCEKQTYSKNLFRTRPGAIFFSIILEPLLGVERTFYLEDKRRIFNVSRYVRPINDIFNYVWIY